VKAKQNINNDDDTWALLKIYRRGHYYNYDAVAERRYIKTHRRRISAANEILWRLGLITADVDNPIGFTRSSSMYKQLSKRSMVHSKRSSGSASDHVIFDTIAAAASSQTSGDVRARDYVNSLLFYLGLAMVAKNGDLIPTLALKRLVAAWQRQVKK
jgi:hypothetical protein